MGGSCGSTASDTTEVSRGYFELPRGTMRFKGGPHYTGTIHASFRDIDPVRYDGTREPSPWLMEIDFGVLAVGLEKSGTHLGIQLADVGEWFDEKAGIHRR